MNLLSILARTHLCYSLFSHAIYALLTSVLINIFLFINVGLFHLLLSDLMKIKRLTIIKFTANRFFKLSGPIKFYLIRNIVIIIVNLI